MQRGAMAAAAAAAAPPLLNILSILQNPNFQLRKFHSHSFIKPLKKKFNLPSSSKPRNFLKKSFSISSSRELDISQDFSSELEPYLSCSMPGKQLKVAVLLSGGVDSSVALRLLHQAGHSCTAFYLKIWFQEDYENFWSACPWDEDLKYAEAVCDQIGVPLEIVHLTDEYWKNVVSYIIEEYRCGRTPNPDVLCNTRIKFGAFMDAINNMEFDYVGSGHYARVVHSNYHGDGPSALELSKDMVKDQTYFLSHLSQSQLKRLLFPLGCIPKVNVVQKPGRIAQIIGPVLDVFFPPGKMPNIYTALVVKGGETAGQQVNVTCEDEVRKLATKLDLPNKDRKDSQGICFLGKIKFSEFVARHIGESEGVLLEAESGSYLGKHKGFWFYTIGQRQGLRLPGGPWYVIEKDVQNNVVFVSRNYFSIDKRRRRFRVGSLKWLSQSPPDHVEQLLCKVRHGPNFYSCSLTMEPGGEDGQGDAAVVHLSEDDQGLAAGQFTAFYRGTTCIGSGIILESWDDEGFPVCAKALEIARMEDKSKLGQPVKIKTKPESPPKNSKKQDIIEESVTAQPNSTELTDLERQKSLTWLERLKEKWLQIF